MRHTVKIKLASGGKEKADKDNSSIIKYLHSAVDALPGRGHGDGRSFIIQFHPQPAMNMPDEQHIEFNEEELRQKINLETGKLGWDELARPFAQGLVVVISAKLDLIDTAVKFCADDKAQIETWAKAGLIYRPLDDDARRWNDGGSVFWSTVVAPWVLVQEIAKDN